MQPSTDPLLGELRPSEIEDAWESRVRLGEQTVGFIIGGESGPDPRLIEHAREIVRTYPAFQRMVTNFLDVEAFKMKDAELREEISHLAIDDVCLFWPERPNDGMIFFKGPDEFRVWRCDYLDRKPVHLGFDR